MRIVDPLRQPELAATHRGVVPPLLPTLALALVAGLLSLACHEPTPTPAKAAFVRPPAMASAPGLSAFDPGRALVGADLAPVPASEAFARLVPLVAMVEPQARAAQIGSQVGSQVAAQVTVQVTGPARSERRRPAPNRLAATPPAATQASAAKAPADAVVPTAVATEPAGGRLLPDGALPFVDTADAVWDAARTLGTGVTSVGSSVITLVSDLR
ncbi:hypothetical protein [Methylobacterium sp. Leaf118]|uniref:hypothetical protein n=1 Tax=Methylobacterium sp. Leaf118 TaxID=2876562 RepID=UPI001E4FAEA9|nr:hypothetical protein [Methylobacterium sp. Leaf118]